MLTQVPNALRVAARARTLRDRNAFDAQVFRKQVTRTAEADGTMGGLPTLGGIGVTDNEDESEVEFVLLGEAKVLMTGVYPGTTLSDRRDSVEPEVTVALIEPVVAGAFEPKDSDLVCLLPGAGVVVTMEVTKVLSTAAFPPYAPKYELSPQGDFVFAPELGRDDG